MQKDFKTALDQSITYKVGGKKIYALEMYAGDIITA